MTSSPAHDTRPPPALLDPSKYVFRPIDLRTSDEDELNGVQGDHDFYYDTPELSCSSFPAIEQDETSLLEMELTPYAYTTTNEEIQDRLSLDEDSWSFVLKLAAGDGTTTTTTCEPCEMSLDGTAITDDGDDGGDWCNQESVESSLSSFFADEDEPEPQEETTTMASPQLIVEDEEITRKRNELWKQSLKPVSFFRRCAG